MVTLTRCIQPCTQKWTLKRWQLFLKLTLSNDGIDDIFDFVTLTEDIIDSRAYEDIKNYGSFLSLRKDYKMLVKTFLAYDQYL